MGRRGEDGGIGGGKTGGVGGGGRRRGRDDCLSRPEFDILTCLSYQ